VFLPVALTGHFYLLLQLQYWLATNTDFMDADRNYLYSRQWIFYSELFYYLSECKNTMAYIDIPIVRAVGRTCSHYVNQGDFDGEGRQGRKHGVVELEFDSWVEFDLQLLLIHERVWHTSPSQLVFWMALILLAFVRLLAFAGCSRVGVINVTMNNADATVAKMIPFTVLWLFVIVVILWFICQRLSYTIV